MTLDLPGERPEGVGLHGAQVPGHAVHHAQRPQGVPRVVAQRRAGVEADVRVARDQRVVVEPRVRGGVGNDEHVRFEDRVRAERGIPPAFRPRQAHPRLEPLAVGVDKADQGDWRPTHVRGEASRVVERLLGRRVQNVQPVQAAQPPRLGRGFIGPDHTTWMTSREAGVIAADAVLRHRSPAAATHRGALVRVSADRGRRLARENPHARLRSGVTNVVAARQLSRPRRRRPSVTPHAAASNPADGSGTACANAAASSAPNPAGAPAIGPTGKAWL